MGKRKRVKTQGENEDRSLVDTVVEVVSRERDPYVKTQALWTLGKVGDGKTIPLMLDLLTEEREEVHHSATEALVLVSDRLLAK